MRSLLVNCRDSASKYTAQDHRHDDCRPRDVVIMMAVENHCADCAANVARALVLVPSPSCYRSLRCLR